MYFAFDPFGVLGGSLLRRGGSRFLFRRGIVAGIDHPERQVNILSDKLVLGDARRLFDNESADDEPDVAIRERLARFRAKPELANIRQDLFAIETDIVFDAIVGGQSRNMGQAIANRDRLFAVLSEIGKIFRDGVVVVDFAAFDEDRDGDRGGGHFGEGREIVDRVDGRSLNGRFRLAIPVSAKERELIPAPDRDDCAGEVPVVDPFGDKRVNRVKRIGVHRQLARRDDRRRRLTRGRIIAPLNIVSSQRQERRKRTKNRA